MSVIKFIEVAQLGKSKGIHGSMRWHESLELLNAILESHDHNLILRLRDGSPVPFKVIKIEQENDILIYFEGINTPEKAKDLINSKVLCDKSKIPSDFATTYLSKTEFDFLIGFTIKNIQDQKEGYIEFIESYPSQYMLVLNTNKLVPFIEDFIVEIDHQQRLLIMDLPDGMM